MDYSVHALRTKHKRKDAVVKRKYGKFMEQQSDFCEDIWNHIKSFMIDPFYAKSNMLEYGKEIPLYRSLVFIEHSEAPYRRFNHATLIVGKRFGNLIGLGEYRDENGQLNDTVHYKYYKTRMKVVSLNVHSDDSHTYHTSNYVVDEMPIAPMAERVWWGWWRTDRYSYEVRNMVYRISASMCQDVKILTEQQNFEDVYPQPEPDEFDIIYGLSGFYLLYSAIHTSYIPNPNENLVQATTTSYTPNPNLYNNDSDSDNDY